MSLRILVADDDPDILTLASARLRKSGYEVLRASDGLSALRVAREQAPDVVILDYAMPGMTGADVCRALKADPATRAVPVILLSASAAGIPPEEMARIPMDAFVGKPFEAEELLEAIARLCRLPPRARASPGRSPAP